MKSWKHQIDAVNYLMDRVSRDLYYGGLYTDMGSGKTKIMIDFMNKLKLNKVIVLCPQKAIATWDEEFVKHSACPFNLIRIDKLKAGIRIEQIEKELQKGILNVLVINYEMIWREPLKSYVLNKFGADFVVCDESHRIKGAGSKVSKVLQVLGRRVKYRYLMTGTPLGDSPLDIYGQYRFLDEKIFGTRKRDFENEYANWVESDGLRWLDKRNPYKNLRKLRKKIFSCAFSVKVYQDLPRVRTIKVFYDISSKAKKLYKELQDENSILMGEDTLTISNIMNMIMRLQQITSGYLVLETPDHKKITKLIDDSRMKCLEDLITGLPKDEPIVIFCKYRQNIKDVLKVMNGLGRSCAEISGKVNQKDAFNAGQYNSVVVQISSGAEAISLVRARYCIYYTLDHSLMKWKQSRKRVHRPGQTRNVTYYVILAKNTVDTAIYLSLKNKHEIIQEVMKHRKIEEGI